MSGPEWHEDFVDALCSRVNEMTPEEHDEFDWNEFWRVKTSTEREQ